MTTLTHISPKSSSEAKNDKKPNHLGRRILVGLGLTAVIASGAAIDHEVNQKEGPDYSQSQLASFPQKPETVKIGQRADNIINEVEPGIGDGTRSDVDTYIDRQGHAEHDGLPELEIGQQVFVPEVPKR